jgi:hypothetical protein
MDLKTEEIYIYYDIPLVFSAKNVETGDIFMCLFVDESDSCIKYLGTQVSEQTLRDLECNKKDIRSVFESPGKKYCILFHDKSPDSSDRVEALESSEDITPFLPEEGLFIGGQENKAPQGIPASAALAGVR